MNHARLAVHGHFYQPSRYDPFTGKVPPDPTAAPAANWNARVADEAYRPNAERRNLGRMGWDLGPTLATWLRSERPTLHAQIVAQDDGHNAIAQGFHHAILPLASTRDRRTEIRWGLRDFELRFGRRATGMWLPETAVDHLTLQVCAEEGVRWTILAPWQAERAVEGGPPRRVALEGTSIAVVFYDAVVSSAVSFDPGATRDADRFAIQVVRPRLDALDAIAGAGAGGFEGLVGGASLVRGSAAMREPAQATPRQRRAAETVDRLLLIASDGELYGHHQKFRDLFLERLLTFHDGMGLTTAGAVLDSVRVEDLPLGAVRDQTSWSCHHGVARWGGECPCAPDGRWKRPLRQALDRLAAAIDVETESRLAAMGLDAWALRDRYVEVVAEFIEPDAWAERELRHAGHGSRQPRRERMLTLMRAQASRLAMFASDGWFWDDPRRLETGQVLRLAAHAARLIDGNVGGRLEALLIDDLRAMRAPGDGPDGAHLFAGALAVVGQPPPRWLEH